MEFAAAGLSGATAPVTAPFVRCVEDWWNLRRFTKRATAGIVCPKGRIHNLPCYVDHVPLSKTVLRAEPWLVRSLLEPDVPLFFVTAVLLDRGLWSERETSWFRSQTITVLGPRRAYERLAVIIASVKTGALRRTCCEFGTACGTSQGSGQQDSTADASFVTCEVQPFEDDEEPDCASFVTCDSQLFVDAEEPDGPVNVGGDIRARAQQDWFGYRSDWSEPGGAFAATEPHDGLPVSMPPKVVVPMELRIHTSHVSLFLSHRACSEIWEG